MYYEKYEEKYNKLPRMKKPSMPSPSDFSRAEYLEALLDYAEEIGRYEKNCTELENEKMRLFDSLHTDLQFGLGTLYLHKEPLLWSLAVEYGKGDFKRVEEYYTEMYIMLS